MATASSSEAGHAIECKARSVHDEASVHRTVSGRARGEFFVHDLRSGYNRLQPIEKGPHEHHDDRTSRSPGSDAWAGRWPASSIDAGFPVTVYNRSSSVADAFAAETGATAVASSRSLGERCSVVVTMLSDGPALLDLLGGDDGLVAGLSAGAIVIDMGTTRRRAHQRGAAPAGRRRRSPRRGAGVGKRRRGGVAQAVDHGRR